MTATVHVPVLLQECIEALKVRDGGRYLDCTLGGGGHSEAILSASEGCTLVSFDRDQRAVERAVERLAPFGERFTAVHAPFSKVVDTEQGRFDGILADLGISSDQLAEGRGFSFRDDGPLDMRMDESAPRTADEVVNTYGEGQLIRVLKRGGCGSEARYVARAILKHRPLRSTADLNQLVQGVMKGRKSGKSSNPATVVFQAIRIEVNGEFEEIETLLDGIPQLAHPGGRVAVISFHSLEDKLIASRMRDWEGRDHMPALHPGRREVVSLGRLLTRKAILPSEQECEVNSRARSARLRIFEFSNKGSSDGE